MILKQIAGSHVETFCLYIPVNSINKHKSVSQKPRSLRSIRWNSPHENHMKNIHIYVKIYRTANKHTEATTTTAVI